MTLRNACITICLGMALAGKTCAVAAGQSTSVPLSAPTVLFPASKVSAAIEEHMNETGALGIAVAVIQNRSVVYQRAFGVRDQVHKLPVDADTRFEIGSITKQFTAAAILQLKEQGRLALEDRLDKYVPSSRTPVRLPFGNC